VLCSSDRVESLPFAKASGRGNKNLAWLRGWVVLQDRCCLAMVTCFQEGGCTMQKGILKVTLNIQKS